MTWNWHWTEGLRLTTPHLMSYRERPTTLLEIGIFEGRSAWWFFQEVLVHPDSHYTGIDDWWTYLTANHRAVLKQDDEDDEGDEDQLRHGQLTVSNQEQLRWIRDMRANAMNKFALVPSDKWTIIEKPSSQALYDLHLEEARFDIVYIDADQHCGANFLDAMLSWPLVNDLLIWDRAEVREIEAAIRYFLEFIPGEYQVVFLPTNTHRQFAIQKRRGVLPRFVKNGPLRETVRPRSFV